MRNKLYTLLAFGMLSISACQPSQKSEATAEQNADSTAAVRQVLEEQAACWSAGDLECYMQGYWKSDSLLFIGSRGLTYGWQPTLDNYKRGYPDVSAMGKLAFDLKEFRQLSPETMLVVGKWHLQRDAEKGDLEGHFSVIFRKFPEGWRIIADHSS
ncbi:ketosteroid isomerase-like protein [Pontibacter mucosus]|uniref:Ketosteroid isomerase-like protein n=1 Tax=Pontibacter mucosus TaxID=1649266 RepID=A0A2T5YE26_9BACT|nr:nuclear transport factor 2 family protein [Pontibacter mucosus]PTX14957.1 ketosteroid isomerase-like protein [Pontibacter mucosus]